MLNDNANDTPPWGYFSSFFVSLGKVKKKKNITVHDMSDIDENFIASKCRTL